jgi:hypothetical protein
LSVFLRPDADIVILGLLLLLIVGVAMTAEAVPGSC